MQFFALEELVDRATHQKYGDKAWELFETESLIMLDDLRRFFNVGVIVNTWWGHPQGYQYRGYRSQDCKVGAANSYHKRGMAFDCDIKGYTAELARKVILENKDDPLLNRIMRMEADVAWLHIDRGQVPEGKERIYVFRG